jgi:hypothetical protein
MGGKHATVTDHDEDSIDDDSLEYHQPVPGRIEAETFDDYGGVGGSGDDRYATGEVTLRHHGEDSLHAAWLKSDQWLAYDADIEGAGAYVLTVRVAAAPEYGGGRLKIECDGAPVGTLELPSTGGWYDFETVSVRVGLAAGQRRLRVVAEEGGFSLDWVDLSRPE